MSWKVTEVNTSVYVPADVYVLPLIVYEPPEQKLCGLLVVIAAGIVGGNFTKLYKREYYAH